LTLATISLCLAGSALADKSASPPQSASVPTAGAGQWIPVFVTDDPLNITIVESQSEMAGHDMDLHWEALANAIGHNATIVEQTALDDIANLAGTDLLIVASGVIGLPANRIDTIMLFVQGGGPTYMQGEYICTYSSNMAYEQIVDTLGGSYTRTGTVAGTLAPMNVLGQLSFHPNSVPTLEYFWYGCAGEGDATVEHFLEFEGQYFGHIFHPPNMIHGKVLFTSDQDWVRQSDINPEAVALMENILTFMAETVVTPVENSTWSGVKADYR